MFKEAAVEGGPKVGVGKHLFGKSESKHLGDSAFNLVNRKARVKYAAGVVGGDVTQDPNSSGVGIYLDLGKVGSERVDNVFGTAGRDRGFDFDRSRMLR